MVWCLFFLVPLNHFTNWLSDWLNYLEFISNWVILGFFILIGKGLQVLKCKMIPENFFWIRRTLVGVLRVITLPEFDPTRSKETNYPTRTRPENFGKAFDPTRPVPGFLRAYPTRTDPKFKLKQNFLKIALLLRKIEGF